EQFKAYAKTMVAKMILTQLFAMPAFAALFDTLQALGNFRVELFNTNCNLADIRKDATELYVSNCEKQLGGGADAITKCRDQYSAESKNLLAQAAEKMEFFKTANSNVTEGVESTGFCTGSLNCGLGAFLPGIQICSTANLGANSGGCYDSRNPGNIKQPLLGYGKLMVATNSAISTVNEALSDTIASTLDAGFSLTQLTISRANQLAAGATAAVTAATDAAVASNYSYFTLDMSPVMYGAAAAEPSEEDKKEILALKEFLQCSKWEDPFVDLLNFSAQMQKDWPDKATEIKQIIDRTVEEANERRKKISELIKIDKTVVSDATYNRITQGKLPQLQKLLNTAINCVFNHHVHVSVDTVLDLQLLSPAEQQGYYAASANRTAYLVTELLMRYVKSKILESHVELASTHEGHPYYKGGLDGSTNNACPKNAEAPLTPYEIKEARNKAAKEKKPLPKACTKENWPYPEGMMDAILTMAEMVENQLSALKAIREERDMFAEISGRIRQKLQQQKQENIDSIPMM
ncbi:MAG: hypothetical protein WAX89_05435, partial [Alphaproteobacteria bacterium]